MKKANHSMLQGPLLGSIITYTVPIILTSILQLLFNAADLVIVGRYRGSLSVAAVSATSSLIMLIINLFIGLSVGAGVSVAHAVGSREDTTVHRTVHTALPLALVGGAAVTLIGVLFSEHFLTWMGTPTNVLHLSALYMKIYFGGMIFTMVYNFCASILRALGDTKTPLIFLAISGVVNVCFNILFITAFDMNVEGVALATTIAQAISAVLVVIALMRRTDAAKLNLKKIRFYKAPLLKMLRIGLPAGIQSSLFSISNVTIQSAINSFGDVVMSGNGAAASIEGFVYVSLNAFQQTAINFVGQNTGAHQYKRVKKIYLLCIICAVVASATLGGLAYAFGEQLLSIYIVDSVDAIKYGLTRLSMIALLYFLYAFTDVTTGALRGLGASLTPMLISIMGICGLRIVWVYTVFQIPEYHTPRCLYLSYPISWVVTFIFQAICFIYIYKKRLKSDQLAL